MANYYDMSRGHIRQIFTMLAFVRCLWVISYHRVLQWALRITKKSYKLNSIQKTLLGGDALKMPKYGQKSTFDRKVLESPFFNQNDCNRNSKIFPYVWGHFALKCVLLVQWVN